MALLTPISIELKNSLSVCIRSYRLGDEIALQRFMNLVGKESQNTLKYDGMQDIPHDKLTSLFTDYGETSANLFIGVFLDDEVIGNLRFMQIRPDHPWISHIGSFGMAVLEQYWNQGVGSLLLQTMAAHAQSVGIIRIEAEVRVDNERGIHLYQKNGFKIEGRKEKAAFIDGKFIDNFFIAKDLSV